MKTYVNDEVMEEVESEVQITSFLAAIYNTNPDTDFVRLIEEMELDSISDSDVKESLQKMKNDSIKARGSAEKLLDMKRDWTKLFRGVSPDYGPSAPYAQEYVENKNSRFLAEISELYRQAGYGNYQEFNDRLDYIGIQLDFIKNINVLRKNALTSGGPKEYERLTDIRNNFGSRYLASWFPIFHQKSQKHVQTDFYKGGLDFTLIYANSFV